MPSKDSHINFALMRERILANQGKEYWRSLEEFADTDEFHEFVEREYPQHAEEWNDPVERRTFLKIMGASLALAGLGGCVYQPPESIVPYVRQSEELVPGKALFFATAFSLSGVATGLLAKSNEGRPTKIEGNPDHPTSLGATDLFAQASLLTLYDPERSQVITYREQQRPWTEFLTEIRKVLDEQKGKQGAGLRFLTETVTSPTLGSQLKAILAEYPQAKWYQYEPAGRDNARMGAMAAFGQPVNTIYRFDLAERVLSLDSDFLTCGPGTVRYVRDFIAKRKVAEDKTTMNRLYAVESTPTLTGAKADHRLALRPSEVEGFARAVATALGANTGGSTAPAYTQHASWIAALVRDLQANRGKCVVIPGDEQSPAVHALAHAMNETLGNVGQTALYTDPLEIASNDEQARKSQVEGFRELVGEMDAGRVEALIMLGGNPVYNAPADLRFDKARLDKVKLRVHLSLYKDETSELCHWHIPESHYLEAWSDARSYDGTVSIVQPLIEPLYNSKSAHEFLGAFATDTSMTGYDIVRRYWQGQRIVAGGQGTGAGQGQSAQGQTSQAGAQPSASPTAQASSNTRPAAQASATPAAQGTPAAQSSPTTTTAASAPAQDFEAAWRKAVHDGVIPNTALQTRAGLSVKGDWARQNGTQAAPAGGYEIVFRTDPTIYDGRFSNNGWLQELPKPLTKLTWDNAALISPNTARNLGIAQDIGTHGGNIWVDTVTLKLGGHQTSKAVPIWIMPGQPDNVVTVHLGYGRTRAGRVGNGAGFSAYEIRPSNSLWMGSGLEISKGADRYELAATQLHFNMQGRDIVREKTLVDYLKESTEEHKEELRKHEEELDNLSMYPEYEYKGYAWGMAIDVSSCVGCSACVVACQSENNIPVVGKAQVGRSREMHWLRVDSYFKGRDENNPEGMYFMPVPCMHCENAPCEPVCPVHATVHSAEGLNDMVYNRCVGTRYCSNNCPYKVRHFNFLLYQDFNTPTYKLMRNPEVSVRSRGVMEKCTYCVQRIQNAKIEAEKDGRHVRDGEIVTACQAVCPAEAIVFGNINDPNSRVSKLKAQQRNYALLAELNTQPRTTYLASLRNPNEEIEKA